MELLHLHSKKSNSSSLFRMGDGFGRFCWILFSWIIILCIHQVRLSKPQLDGRCDLFRGSWVFDETYPLYNISDCPFIEKEFDCQANGRPDQLYLKYRWKPSNCMLPRFNGHDLMRKLRGKKILFIGDSLSLNQWQSLTCMLYTAVPQANYTLTRKGDLSTFSFPLLFEENYDTLPQIKLEKEEIKELDPYLTRIFETQLKDYGVSLMLSRNAFLVDLVREKRGTVLKLDSIENGRFWKRYDFLIFNTWHWWLHRGRKQPWNFIESRGEVKKDMDRMVAFKEGLTTWSKWVDSNVNTSNTQVFFQGISPTHFNGREWNETKSTSCWGETEPASSSTSAVGTQQPAVRILKQVLRNMSTPVVLLDITRLSQLRKDGHPSIYTGLKGNDCSHWCLAGVPDTWNQLLYAFLTNTDHYSRL